MPELPELEAAAGGALVESSSTAIPDDWADRWRDFHQPVLFGGGWSSVPPGSGPAASDAEAAIEVVIDPGQAFGTGAHPTTSLASSCCSSSPTEPARGPLADLGTGSAVLAIAAAKLGWPDARLSTTSWRR